MCDFRRCGCPARSPGGARGSSPMTLYEIAFAPFAEFGFMRRGLVACVALAQGCGPIGTILVIRRMSLMGDALSHAVLPGAAFGFIFAGLWLPAMTLGGAAAGLAVAFLSGLVTRLTPLHEDASFAAAFHLISLALGSWYRPMAATSICCTGCSDPFLRSMTRHSF